MCDEKEKQCDICKVPHFERNNYFYGKLMTVRDFSAEQHYFNEKRWLINRMVNGWGVVCGLDVKPIEGETDKVLVTPGLAIDCCGREILVCEEQGVTLVPVESACHKGKEEKEQVEKKLLICLEYHECKTEPIHLPPVACDQKEKGEFNRIRDSFKISSIPLSEQESQPEPFCPQTKEDKEKSLHQYLCDRLREGCPECPDPQCNILAIVTVDQDGNLIEIDTCSKRKLVYNNPMLYDLINCFHGDLPHIIGINWKDLHVREDVSWNDFTNIVESGLTVTFDKPMAPDTINRHTFLFAVITVEEATGYRRLKYIPSREILKEGTVIDGKKATFEATFIVEDGWKRDEMEGVHSEIRHGADFEIILRGSSIVSINGKALDGNFIGGKLPSGNGTQGGDFVSWFSVEPKGQIPKPPKPKPEEAGK